MERLAKVRIDVVTLPEHVRELLRRNSTGSWGGGGIEFHVVPVAVADMARKLGGTGVMGSELARRP